MSSKTKKPSKQPEVIKPVITGNKKTGIIPPIFIFLYILAEVIPESGATDVMGAQWLYLAFLDIFCIGYFILNKTGQPYKQIRPVIMNQQSMALLALFTLCGLSIFFAINKTESLVSYSRFIITVVAYFNLALLLVSQMHLFRFFAQALSILLFIQSLYVVSEFYNGYTDGDLEGLILGINGTAGNKNILAASMAIKLPFVLYCIYSFKLWSKVFNAVVICFAVFALAILNARASYLSALLVTVLYLIYCLVTHFKTNKKLTLQNISFFIIPLVGGLLLSQVVLQNAFEQQENTSGYGTVGQRLSTIGFNEESSNYRFLQWKSALQFIEEHPIMGAGYGNWKLASIPYEKDFSNELLVTYHVHNDFLELATETGVPGGILLLSVFVVAFLMALRVLRAGLDTENARIVAFSIMALSVYFIDAFFNFPAERPVMQFFFVFLLALLFNCYFAVTGDKNKANQVPDKKWFSSFVFISMVLLLPATWFSYLTYKSMVAQKEINTDVLLDVPTKSFQEVNASLPSIPNLNAFCFPVDAIKARYLINEKRYDEALLRLNRSEKVNPYLPYSEYLKAKLFFEQKKPDSARIYIDKAFDKRPRSLFILKLSNAISYQLKDTAMLHKTFKTYTGYRKDMVQAWNDYLGYLHEMPHDTRYLESVLDSALKLFPDNADLKQKKLSLVYSNESPAYKAAEPYIAKAMQASNQRDYTRAAENFAKAAELNPMDHRNWENLGLCYYLQNNFSQALIYFDKVLALNTATDGKSEYLKGMCLIRTGDKNRGCQYLQQSQTKNYSEAASQIKINCQ